jgi:glutaminyl-tRNA synthetase
MLRSLVEDGHVSGWDDPRMPTSRDAPARLPAAAIRRFCTDVGIAKRENTIQLARLEASCATI